MEKKKKILLGIAGVALAAAVGYYFYDKKKKATTALAPSQEPVPIPISLPATSGNTGIVNPIQQQTQAALETSSAPSISVLASKTWQVNGKQYAGSTLNIRYTTDGRVLIGSGYIGRFVGNNIVTEERNGAPDPIKTWTPLNGVAGLRGLGSYNMSF